MTAVGQPENLSRFELLRRLYDNPTKALVFEGDIPLGLLAAADFIRLAGLHRYKGGTLSSQELRWATTLSTLHSIAVAVINGQSHPFFDQQQDAIAANGGGRPGPTAMEAECRARITDVTVALARHLKEGDAGQKRIAGKYGGKTGLRQARTLLAGHLQRHGYPVTEEQLKNWAEWVNDEIMKFSGDDRVVARREQAAAQRRYLTMSWADLLTEAANQMVWAQPVSALGINSSGKPPTVIR